jgi:multidrug resistance efflux pump
MKRVLTLIGRVVVTLVVVAAAAAVGYGLWSRYMLEPWTRDGRVRADIVTVAPDVSGLVISVDVQDNAVVKKGDLLFRIDPDRFAYARDKADAAVAAARAAVDQTRLDEARYDQLTGVTSEQKIEEARSARLKAEADFRSAVAARGVAQLDLDRAQIRAPVNGVVANLSLRPGDYISAGKGALALIDTDSLRVEGYFEETKLPRIAIGAPARITFPGQSVTIRGHVESIAGGIEDRERTDGAGSLANVNPTFTWVRLAQRIPVRIAIDSVPDGVRLIAGQTATVAIDPPSANAAANAAHAP